MWSLNNKKNLTALKTDNGEFITYGRLYQEGNQLASAIGDRCLVFSLCSNTIGSVLGYTAFIENRIVPVMLSAQLDEDLLHNLLDEYKPSYVWAPKSRLFSDMEEVYSAYDYMLLKTSYTEKYPLNDELALLLTTSGSTGSPKFVRQSYKNIETNTRQIVEYLRITADERPITTLPMNYTYGLSIINTHLSVGATILLTDKALMQKEFWTFLREGQATSISGVPYTYEMLDKLRFFRMDLPYLRCMTQAGGKLSLELHKRFAQYAQENAKRFIVMYGACEATARMGYLPAEKSLEKYGSCGIAIPNGKFYLLDVNDEIINEPDVEGELIYEGDNVTLGYAECGADLIKGDKRGGVLHTGDMAKRDSEGFYFITGRKKRFLKIYGNRVNLDEIDRLIKVGFDNMDCASAGVDDRMYIFVTEDGVDEAVRKYISEKTKLNPSAFKVIKIDEIPKNESGKILYKALEKYYV